MAANNTGTYHLADNPKLYEPARSNNFEFIVIGLDRLLKAGKLEGIDTEDNNYITNAQEIIRMSVAESSVPNFELGVIEIKRGNNTIKFAGTPTFNSGTLTLNDYIGAKTKDALLAWKALAYDVRTEKVHTSDKYKFNCKLVEYTPDYESVIRTWDLIGCWISATNESNFSMDSTDKRTFEATIQYDKAIPVSED